MRFLFLLNLLVGDIMAKLVINVSFKNKNNNCGPCQLAEFLCPKIKKNLN
jgi:hypothetical protein